MVKLFCALVGVEGSAFPVDIDATQTVGDLKDAIHAKIKKTITCDAYKLQVYLAKKDDDTWLTENDIKGVNDTNGLKHLDVARAKLRSKGLSETQLGGVNEEEEAAGNGPVHVLVVIPEGAARVESTKEQRTWFWLVSGSVENALHTRGVRSRIYRIADAELGYYDPTNVFADNNVQAFWYANNDLQIHVLFKEETHALYFQSRLNAEFITIPITSFVSQVPCPTYQQRIFSRDYVAEDTESPQETISSVPSEFSVIDTDNPVFKYQRIEADGWFGPYGKAESAHLMSKSHCNLFQSNKKYDDDDNNRLALSREMHSAYDMLGFFFPVVNMEVVSVSHGPVLDNRFKVELNVSVYSQDYIFLLSRLKDESMRTSDPLVMKTFVHVENPAIFCKCMAWKYKKNEMLRQAYFEMKPAVK